MWRHRAAIATLPSPNSAPWCWANPAADRGSPCRPRSRPLAAGSAWPMPLWQAQDTLLVLDAVPLDALLDLLYSQRKAWWAPRCTMSACTPRVGARRQLFSGRANLLLEAEGLADRFCGCGGDEHGQNNPHTPFTQPPQFLHTRPEHQNPGGGQHCQGV